MLSIYLLSFSGNVQKGSVNDSVYKVLVNTICTFEEISFPNDNKTAFVIFLYIMNENDYMEVRCFPFEHEHPPSGTRPRAWPDENPVPFVHFYSLIFIKNSVQTYTKEMNPENHIKRMHFFQKILFIAFFQNRPVQEK